MSTPPLMMEAETISVDESAMTNINGEYKEGSSTSFSDSEALAMLVQVARTPRTRYREHRTRYIEHRTRYRENRTRYREHRTRYGEPIASNSHCGNCVPFYLIENGLVHENVNS